MNAGHGRAADRNTKRAADGTSWAKAKTKRERNPHGSKGERTALIEKSVAKGNWAKARSLVQEELVSQPMDHWLWLSLGCAYYEEKSYEKALTCSKRAVELAPDCPLALWYYAGSLYMLDRESSAFAIWTLLLNMDLDEIAYGEHGEGMDSAMQLVNDVQYSVGRYFQRIGKTELAKESFEKYLHNRAHGLGSIYDKQKVEEWLAALQ